MKRIGKLIVRLAQVKGKPDIFTISTINTINGDTMTELFSVVDNRLTLRISKETALQLAQFIDDTLDEEMTNAGSNQS